MVELRKSTSRKSFAFKRKYLTYSNWKTDVHKLPLRQRRTNIRRFAVVRGDEIAVPRENVTAMFYILSQKAKNNKTAACSFFYFKVMPNFHLKIRFSFRYIIIKYKKYKL